MRSLLALASVALFVGSAAPASALMPMAKPEGQSAVIPIADLDRSAMPVRHRKARVHRHRHGYGYWRNQDGVVITSGHRLHRFRGEIIYTYGPPDCCDPRR